MASAVAPDGRGGGDPVPEAQPFCSSLVVMVNRMHLRIHIQGSLNYILIFGGIIQMLQMYGTLEGFPL